MSKIPQLNCSGYRGIWGESLTEEIAGEYFEAFSQFLIKRNAKKILVAHDARPSGLDIKKVALEIFTKNGIDIIDGGLLPTPTVIFTVRNMRLDGALMITASHNPPQYNGLKFITGKALFTDEVEVEEIKGYLNSAKNDISLTNEKGQIIQNSELGEMHIQKILDNVDVEKIKSKKFKVVLDPINSVGCIIGPKLLESLGCEVVVINGTPDGNFAHIPEPLPENLSGLGEKVLEMKADIGFALDPDGDRLVLCDERGVVVFEEYTLTLAIQAILAKNPSDIVQNLSTTNTNEDLANALGYRAYRTKVGEANVVEGMLKHNANIGGEGGGGVIYPAINLCRDGLVGIALILETLANTDKKLSEIVDELPKYKMLKTKISFAGDLQEIFKKIQTYFKNINNEIQIDTQDGLRIDFPDRSWVQIRASNTEPIIRIFAEAKTEERIEELVNEVKNLI